MTRAHPCWRENRSYSPAPLAWYFAWIGLVWVAAPATGSAQTSKGQASPGEVSYRRAVAELESGGSTDQVLQRLAEAFEAGWKQPSRVLVEPNWDAFRRSPESRAKLRKWMETHASESDLSMTAPDEPGRKLDLTLTFRDRESNEPLAGRAVFLYHTDDAGDYTPEAASAGAGSDNPRLFAAGRTDAEGRLRIRSVVPGCYRGTNNPRHIHLHVERPGGAPFGTGVYFEVDHDLDDELREETARGRVFTAPLPAGNDAAMIQMDLRVPRG